MNATKTPAAATPAPWVNGAQAKRILGVNWYRLHHHVIVGNIAVRTDPGTPILYSRADLERLAAERGAGR